MPAARTYPGVYIEEVASGVHTIIGVATSITAFIGRTERGPDDAPGRVQNFADFERLYGGLWPDSTLSYAVQQFFTNGGSDALIVRVHNGAQPATCAAYAGLPLTAANPGAWGNNLLVRVDLHTKPAAPGEILFNLAAYDTDTKSMERFLNVSPTPAHPRFVTRVLEEQSQLIRTAGVLGAAAPPANADIPAAGVPNQFIAPYWTAFNQNGLDGNNIGPAQIIGAAHQGLYMLEQADLFNLLCIPPFSRDIDVPQAVWDAAAQYCSTRRAILIVDAPAAWDTVDEVTPPAAVPAVITRTDTAAIYFPRILAADPLKDFRNESFAPCGVVAGSIARTDAQRGVWKAPAGLDTTLIGVAALSLGDAPALLTDPQIGQLNPLGVNCLRTVPNVGQVIWGARTLNGLDQLASEWKYLPVRRLAYYIEESLYRGTQWAVFEPNDEPLWGQLRMNVNSFMQGLFRQGAFQGASAREAYFVKCSSETTVQADIDAGIVNVLVGFAPLKPAEFVVIRIQQMIQQDQ